MRTMCIQGDADRFHVRCAEKKYGRERIQAVISQQKQYSPDTIVHNMIDSAPLDAEGNPLWAIFEDGWKAEKSKAKTFHESIYESCGVCLKRIR